MAYTSHLSSFVNGSVHSFNFSIMTTNLESPATTINRQTALIQDTDTGDTERQSITVSKETFAYLKCLQQLDTLWEYVYKALELSYGWKTADELMDDEYCQKNCAIRDMINEYMCISIGERVNCNTGMTEI